MGSTFTSKKEKRYWILVMIVVGAIFISLFYIDPFEALLRDQNIQAVIFLTGMVLVATTVIIHGLRKGTSGAEIAVYAGLAAIAIMLFFRLGAPERSHVIEYGVLGIFLHKALLERKKNGQFHHNPAWVALGVGVLLGLGDEVLQYCVPLRRFDPYDMVFNTMAVSGAIGVSVLLQWIRNRFNNK